MRILAIDPATTAGWASPTSSGIIDSKLRSYESKGMKFIRFRARVKELILSDDIEVVVYEKPISSQYNGTRSGANYEAMIITLCEELKVDYKDYSPTEIKSFAWKYWQEKTKKKADKKPNKATMVKYAEEVFSDIELIDDNHADALWLYEMAVEEFN